MEHTSLLNYNAQDQYILNLSYIFQTLDFTKPITLANAWQLLVDSWNLPHDDWRITMISHALENVASVALKQLMSIRPNTTLDTFEKLFTAKSAGYAGFDSDPWKNFRNCTVFDIPVTTGLITRLSDKYMRAMNLLMSTGEDRVGESLADTLFDLVAYSCILLTIIDNEGMI